MSRKLIHVAAAVIKNELGDVLIAKRSAEQHQGGLWEFPGGKVEQNEDAITALSRELNEELGIKIDVDMTRPLIKVPHHYSDKSVLLDVFEVESFEGTAWGREGQPLLWVPKSALDAYEFPAANRSILNAFLLPKSIAITPSDLTALDIENFVQLAAAEGAEAIMLRKPHSSPEEFKTAFNQIQLSNVALNLPLFANCSLKLANELGVNGLHLTSARLCELQSRSDFSGRWLSASCHSEEELAMAVEKGIDFVTLSPVCYTESHPETTPLGWEKFEELVAECTIPVFALGGVNKHDISMAVELGAQGIAAIRGWSS